MTGTTITHCPSHHVPLGEHYGETFCRICIEPRCDVCEEHAPLCVCDKDAI